MEMGLHDVCGVEIMRVKGAGWLKEVGNNFIVFLPLRSRLAEQEIFHKEGQIKKREREEVLKYAKKTRFGELNQIKKKKKKTKE
jgi:hypothetical protein